MTVTAHVSGVRPPDRDRTPLPNTNRAHSTSHEGVASRPRCVRCGHPIASVRSLARGLGRVCAAKAGVEALDARRDAVGRRLASLARLVAVLDAEGVERASEAVDVALAAVVGGGRR